MSDCRAWFPDSRASGVQQLSTIYFQLSTINYPLKRFDDIGKAIYADDEQ
ncbi:hypothetical protein [Tolypothrix sp. NIES-4075]|nr:hypothetical protein [Tolypothrix sp. NIES-4075]